MSSRASSLLLLNSYGKDEEEEVVDPNTINISTIEITTTETTNTTTTTTTTSAFSLVGYEHDEDDEDISNVQENLGRAVINPPRALGIETVTPPPTSPPDTTNTTDMTDSITNSISPTNEGGIASNTASLRGITLHSSPFRCEAYLQPEPVHAVASALQERVVRFFALKSGGKSINDIRKNKAYKNPDILEKLVQHCGINEIGSNYPTELFDPLAFQPTDFYDSIALEQRRMEEKRPEDRSGSRNIEFTSATASTTSTKVQSDDKKRSKWDSMDSAAATIMAGGAKLTLPPNATNPNAVATTNPTNPSGASSGPSGPSGSSTDVNPTVTVITGTAPPTSNDMLSSAYVEYIKRKKREGTDTTKEANKKAKK